MLVMPFIVDIRWKHPLAITYTLLLTIKHLSKNITSLLNIGSIHILRFNTIQQMHREILLNQSFIHRLHL